MPEADGTCEYVLDPDDPKTWGGQENDECKVDNDVLNEDGVWTCPHEAKKSISTTDGEESLCIFHLPLEKKDEERVLDAFLERVESMSEGDAEQRTRQFLGTKFGTLDISNQRELERIHSTIQLSYADITGVAYLSGITFEKSAFFTGATFEAGAVFSRTTFKSAAVFKDTSLKADPSKGTIASNFVETTFEGTADFTDAELRSKFNEATFEGSAIFQGATFEKVIKFQDTTFEDEANFGVAKFGHIAQFSDATFEEKAIFAGAAFSAIGVFKDATFEAGVFFNKISLPYSRFTRADLTDATFTEATLCEVDFESALLSRASFLDADLRGAKLSGAVLGDIRINEGTQFLGRPGDGVASPHTLSAIRSGPTCAYDQNYKTNNRNEDVAKAKSVYRMLEELGQQHARPRLQARSFVRRQDLQKEEYKRYAKETESWEERLIAGARWSRSKVSRMILLYGESPWRVIGWSLGIIFSFALLYPLGGWMEPEGGDPITYSQIASNPAEILNSVYYSTLTYTALGFGDFQPVGLGRLLTTIETGLGAVMLALLVFILGRRAAR